MDNYRAVGDVVMLNFSGPGNFSTNRKTLRSATEGLTGTVANVFVYLTSKRALDGIE